jgi:hypothetical protein
VFLFGHTDTSPATGVAAPMLVLDQTNELPGQRSFFSPQRFFDQSAGQQTKRNAEVIFAAAF